MVDGLRTQALAYALPYVAEPGWVVDALEQHAAWLLDPAHIHHGNHALVQHVGLFVASCVLGSESWRSTAISRLSVHLEESYDDQGVNEEASTGYQVMNYRLWRAIERRLELEGLPPLRGAERLDRAPVFLAHATRPDGRLERIGDTDVVVAADLGHEMTDYVTTDGRVGTPPADLVKVFDSGYVFGRSGWGEAERALSDETYFSVRFGRQDAIHGHPDGRSVTYTAGGVNWITDTGKYSYDSSEMRRFVLSRAGQNVVEIDGVGYRRTEVVELVEETHDERFDTFRLLDRGYPGFVIERLVVFSRRGEWLLIHDRVSGDRDATCRVRLHLDADVRIAESGRSLVLASTSSGARATVMFAGRRPQVEVREGSDNPFGGWVSAGWLSRVAAPEILLSKSGQAVRFTTVITPVAVSRQGHLRAREGSTADDIALDIPTPRGTEAIRLTATGVKYESDDRGPEPAPAVAAVEARDRAAAQWADEAWSSPDPTARYALQARVERHLKLADVPHAVHRTVREDLAASLAPGDAPARTPGLHRGGLPRFVREWTRDLDGDGARVHGRSFRLGEEVLPDGSDKPQVLLVDLGPLVLPMRVVLRRSAALVVAFHGALHRGSARLPRFERARTHDGLPVSSLTIADPTLDLADDLTLGWYLGTRGVDLHRVVAGAVRAVARAAGADRIVLTGSSGGGFAALQVASWLPGARCVVFNPQTDVSRYYPRLRERALDAVFGTDGTDRDVPDVRMRTSVIERWAVERPAIEVTYVQNLGDEHHDRHHLVPLLESGERVGGGVELDVRRVEWGPGHVGTTPERYAEHVLPVLGLGADTVSA